MPQPASASVAVLVTAALGLAALPAHAATTPSPRTTTLPVPAATVDPAASVGGPRLASMGVITDLPPGVPAPPTMHDVSWLVADLDTGDVIAAKAPHARLAPASTLKTLTSIVLLPKIDATLSYAATDADTRAGGTRIGLVPGQVYTGRQLFQALLMGSANDAAYALARVGGGIPATLDAMNAEARRLDALDTHAGDPSGLDAAGQTSSAYDLALIGREAMRNADFRTYVTTMAAAFPGYPIASKAPARSSTGSAATHAARSSTSTPPVLTDARGIRRQSYALSNHNTLLYNYPGTIGVKNGFTNEAHRTFIAAARRNGHTYVVTEMGGIDYEQWRPTAALLSWAFAHGRQARPVGRLVEPGERLPFASPAGTAPTATDPAPATGGPPTSGPVALGATAARSTAGAALPGTLEGVAVTLLVALTLLGARHTRGRRYRRRH